MGRLELYARAFVLRTTFILALLIWVPWAYFKLWKMNRRPK